MSNLFLAIIGALLVAVTLPVTLELAVLTLAYFFSKKKARFSTAPAGLRLAVIVPAHNEGLLISRTIESLRVSAGGSDTRIVVIAHNCFDQTAAHAVQAGAEVLIYDDPQAVGKGFALRRGFEYVFSEGAEAALVIDADSVVSANLVGVVRDAISQGAEAVQCRYEIDDSLGNTKSKLAALAVRGFNLIRPCGREALGASAGILGNGFAIRKKVFAEIPYRALSLVEDLEYHLHLVIAGKRVRFLCEARVSAEVPSSPAGETTQRLRWEGGRFLTARQWLGPLLKQVMCGRVRLLEPLLDISSLPLAYAATLLLFGLCLPLGWLRLYSALALTVLGLHVIAAAWAGGNFLGELRPLCMVPAYIFWKFRLLPRLFRGSRTSAVWVRTEREPVARKL